jgi:hypothetical protein
LSSITSLLYYSGLLQAVKAGGEQTVLEYLKRFQRPLWVAFARGWNCIVLIPEFRCGNQYRCDFLLVSAMSGATRATFIELEAPSACLYTRNGTESKELKRALRQVKDWHAWVDQHPHELREQIIRDLEQLPSIDRRVPKHRRDWLRAHLQESRIALLDDYVIVIGRRDDLRIEDNRRRSYEAKWTGHLEIATFDRLLEIGLEDRAMARMNRVSSAIVRV